MYTLTLQREEPTNADSNIGVMTIGGLPSGVSNDSLTWVPVNPYPINDTVIADLTIPVSAEVQAEIEKLMPTIPYRWEAVIDGFFVNGQLASNSSGAKPIALFDSVSEKPYNYPDRRTDHFIYRVRLIWPVNLACYECGCHINVCHMKLPPRTWPLRCYPRPIAMA